MHCGSTSMQVISPGFFQTWIFLLELDVVCVVSAALHIPDGSNGVGVLWVQVIHVVVVR